MSDEVAASDDLVIDAENSDLDTKNNVLHYWGNVTVKLGTLSIKADDLMIYLKDGIGEKLVAKGQPAIFSRSADADSKIDAVDASANEVEFTFEDEVLSFIGDAQFKQGITEMSGDLIEFDLIAERVKAAGNQQEGGRVRTTIRTKKKTESDQEKEQ